MKRLLNPRFWRGVVRSPPSESDARIWVIWRNKTLYAALSQQRVEKLRILESHQGLWLFLYSLACTRGRPGSLFSIILKPADYWALFGVEREMAETLVDIYEKTGVHFSFFMAKKNSLPLKDLELHAERGQY